MHLCILLLFMNLCTSLWSHGMYYVPLSLYLLFYVPYSLYQFFYELPDSFALSFEI